MNDHHLNKSPFLLSLAILNMEVQSPVLFLHILINPKYKTITGSAELSVPNYKSTGTSILNITGEYRSLGDKHQETQHHVSLNGSSSYDQSSSAIKITMSINKEWKKGKACYQYLINENWEVMDNVYLKIKAAPPYVIPTSVLDKQQYPYLPDLIK